jgi:elongation factor P--(R)-beta-lysine ligase
MSAPDSGSLWRPRASAATLALRAALLARTRRFFEERGVLEVDTPLVVRAPVSDPHIHSVEVTLGTVGGFLQTSPEYAMKRLIAAGVGDIYQVCHVVRAGEAGRLHNPEFTLIEWYRRGHSIGALMDEVDALVRSLLSERAQPMKARRLTYREAFLRAHQPDPLGSPIEELLQAARQAGWVPSQERPATRDELLDLLMSTAVAPQLGRDALTFIHDYPASQAALARLNPLDPRVAMRFELYAGDIELANGFDELTAAVEQRARFEADNRARALMGLPVRAPDERLLAALEQGLPPCAGVALGFDRVVMLASGAQEIADVLPFPFDRA